MLNMHCFEFVNTFFCKQLLLWFQYKCFYLLIIPFFTTTSNMHWIIGFELQLGYGSLSSANMMTCENTCDTFPFPLPSFLETPICLDNVWDCICANESKSFSCWVPKLPTIIGSWLSNTKMFVGRILVHFHLWAGKNPH
jgi:hypothetical protein